MKTLVKYWFLSISTLLLILSASNLNAQQNQNSKWFFGNNVGLDFMSNPPAFIFGSSINSFEGCSSISDNSGNLLFYSDGQTIWNQNHNVMANGTGLAGVGTAAQSCLIVQKPGSNSIYYVFTLAGIPSGGNFCYTIVDLSLAAGMGSVTVKNATVYSAPSSPEKLTGTTHCNGIDKWIVIHGYGFSNNNFQSYLLTSAGLNTVAIMSPVGSVNSGYGQGYMKISSSGRKLAVANNGSFMPVELFDFDNQSGAISNPMMLNGPMGAIYGLEFSGDGSKLYASRIGWSSGTEIFQWDLCAGNSLSIISSQYTVTNSGFEKGALQLAPNGKIYCAKPNLQVLGVINNPNAAGAACNYNDIGQALSTGTCLYGLPNFINYKAPRPPFTYTANQSCQTASFTAQLNLQNFQSYYCSVLGYSLNSLSWDFGDPASGINNVSFLATPSHSYTLPGTYTVQLIYNFSCGGGSDTLRQVVNINNPCFSIQSTSITCANLGSASITPLSGGAYTYTWLPTMQTGSAVSNLIPGTYTILAQSQALNVNATPTVVFNPLVPLTGSLSCTQSFVCNGQITGTAAVLNLSGGSANQNFLWTNGTQSTSVANPTNLAAGNWSVSVTDALTACQINSVFTITQPPALTLNIAASSATACAGTGISFTATNSGGTPGASPPYTYTWSGGPPTNTFTSVQSTAGNYVYTVNSSDANNCLSTHTIAVTFVPNPTLSVSDVSICPLEVGTLSVSGASSYTWQASTPLSSVGSTFTDSPVGSTQYSVIGEALSCTSIATASILVKPVPNPLISHNAPLCENLSLVFSVSSGTAAVWSGPLSFTSASINNTISPAQFLQSGLYAVTVTAANACTASTSASLTVKPLPQFSIAPASSSICLNTTSVSLSVSSSTSTSASSYTWFPNIALSNNSGTLVNAFPASTKVYTLVGSLNGCSNTSQATVNVVPPPSLTGAFNSSTLCSQAFNGSPNTITLTAGGASTYSLVTIPDMFNANPAGPVSPLTSIPPYTGAGSATLSGSNGVCSLTLGLSFTVLPNPSITVNNYTPVICAGQSFTYTNQGASSYTWSSATPGSTLYSNGGVAVASPTVNSVFSVYGGSLGCNSALHITSITVNPLPTVQVVPAPAKKCFGDTIVLSALSNGSSFQWLPPYGLNTYTAQQVLAHINISQVYTLTASLNNCSNTAVAAVSVMPLPIPQILAIKDEVCLNEVILLQALGGVTYQWTSPDQQLHPVQNLSITASHMGLAGTYTLKVTDANACVNYSSSPVIVHNLPNAYLVPDRAEFCVPYCNSFTFVPNSQSSITEAGPWTLNTLLFTGHTFTNCFDKSGYFEIKGPIVDEFGCKNSVQLTVIARPKPQAAFYTTPEHPIEGLDEVNFVNVTSNITGYSWQSAGAVGSGQWAGGSGSGQSAVGTWFNFKSEDESPAYLFEEAGIYGLMLIVKNEFNCVDTVMKTIKVESDFTAYIPNAFTPNGDGLNDTFYPVMRGVKQFELQIFDRWGTMIFASNSAEKVWDGTYQGQDCKQDIYNYKLVLLNVKGEEKVYTGMLLLYR